jgi:hypothetical protein
MKQDHLHQSVRIPDGPLKASDGYARMIAMGLIERQDALDSLVEESIRLGCRMEPTVIRSSFAIRLNGTVPHWERQRGKAVAFIKGEIRPLLEQWADQRQILDAAARVNDRLGEPLLWREVKDVVRQELLWVIRRSSQKVR